MQGFSIIIASSYEGRAGTGAAQSSWYGGGGGGGTLFVAKNAADFVAAWGRVGGEGIDAEADTVKLNFC